VAFTQIPADAKANYWVGNSTDPRPAGVAGMWLVELDTGNRYQHDGTGWRYSPQPGEKLVVPNTEESVDLLRQILSTLKDIRESVTGDPTLDNENDPDGGGDLGS
jgi:hypothetical protein